MDILQATAIEFPCDVCGGRRTVTLRQILLSQDMLAHEGCLALHGERECPPAVFATLIDPATIEELQRVWQRLAAGAHAVGGTLIAAETARPGVRTR